MIAPVTSVELKTEPDPLEAGSNSKITCDVTGGKPSPEVHIEFSGGTFAELNGTESVNGSLKSVSFEAVPLLTGTYFLSIV